MVGQLSLILVAELAAVELMEAGKIDCIEEFERCLE